MEFIAFFLGEEIRWIDSNIIIWKSSLSDAFSAR